MFYEVLIQRYFYLETGKLDWDAIGAISNILLVSLLVFVNLLYIREMRRLAKFTNEQIVLSDCIDNFLKPCLDGVGRYIENINNNEFYWYESDGISKISRIGKIAGIVNVKRFAMAYVFKKQYDLKVLCSEYDMLYDKVVQNYDDIARVVKQHSENMICLERYVNEFKNDVNNTGQEGFNLGEFDVRTDLVNTLVNHEFYENYEQEKDGSTRILNYNKDIVKCVKSSDYNELDEARNEKIMAFEQKMRAIVVEVEEIMYHYQQEYYIPLD